MKIINKIFQNTRKYFLFYLLFVISLSINIFYYLNNHSNIPVLVPDSESYIDIAKQIVTHQTPNFSVRSPVYPLFITIFHSIGYIDFSIFAAIVLGSIAPIFLFLIISNLTKNKVFSFFVTIFLSLNYSVSVYQSVMLSESITPFLFLFSLFLHIVFFQTNFSKKLFILLLTIDSLLVLTKPSLCYLPALLFFISYFFTKSKKQFIILGISLNIFLIITQSSVNQIQNHFFGLSEIAQINLLGKNIQYGLLDKSYSTQNPNIKKVLGTYQEVIIEEKQLTNPFLIVLYRLLPRNEISYPFYNYLKPVNDFLIKNNKYTFFKKSIYFTVQNFTSPRKEQPWFQEKYYAHSPLKQINALFEALNRFQLIGFFACLTILLYFVIQNKKEAYTLSLILVSIISTVSFVSFFSYCEYDRLIAHVIYLMNFTVIYPVYFLISHCYTRNNQ